jgi:hypothetical protein
MKFKSLIASLLIATAFVACDDATTIGTSLVDDDVAVIIDSCFTVTGQSFETEGVQSRTLTQLLGDVNIDGFGRMSSTVYTQFMPASEMDTTGVTTASIDSLKLIMTVEKGAFVGDSITPMGLKVYPLTKLLPSPIYSNDELSDYYDSSKVLGSAIYNTTGMTMADTTSYVYIQVQMPVELGQEMFTKYKENPTNFTNPDLFCENVFKGIHIDNSYGSGRMTRIAGSSMLMYYHSTYYDEDIEADTTTYSTGLYWSVTPEVVTNNRIKVELASNLKEMVANGDNIITAPIGYDVELTFPAREILSSYRSNNSDLKVINTLSFNIPVDTIENNAGITPPPYLLMIKKNKREEFFANNSINDNISSFYAAYDSTNKCYTFSSMRDYILDLLDKDEVTDDDVTFVLCPVTVETETTSSYYTTTTSITGIIPYIDEPAMVKVLLDEAKIKFAFSTQSKIF